MIFQEFDKTNRDRIRELREQKKAAQSSSSLWHEQVTVGEDRKMANIHERGQEQKKEDSIFPEKKESEKENNKQETDKESRMEEIFHTENAFARISLGLNEKGESVLVSSRKMRADIKSTERSERELDEQRSYSWRVVGGEDKANFNKPAESAFGFYQQAGGHVGSHTRAHRMVSKAQDFANLTGNLMTNEFIPSKSSAAGETKSLSTRELKLEHQLSIALENGKKKIEEKKDDGIVPKQKMQNDKIHVKPKKKTEETVPKPRKRKKPEEDNDRNGLPPQDAGDVGGQADTSFAYKVVPLVSTPMQGRTVWLKPKSRKKADPGTVKPQRHLNRRRIKAKLKKRKKAAAGLGNQKNLAGLRRKPVDNRWLWALFLTPMVLQEQTEDKVKGKENSKKKDKPAPKRTKKKVAESKPKKDDKEK